MAKINDNLIRERQKCTFDVKELTHLIDGGELHTKERKEIEELVLSVKEIRDEVPEEYLSYKERYENGVRKSLIIYNVLKERMLFQSMEDMGPTTANKFNVIMGVIPGVPPTIVHVTMVLPTILGQATDEQIAEWLPKAINLEFIGTYAQTEMGHGTFVRGLETIAKYDPTTEEFVLNTPTLSAYKWWPGGLGHTANHAIVVAQLHTMGKCVGIHPFFVQIRDLETHMPLPGIHVGDIGPKMAFATGNNGFLGFKNYRIPRKNMMMRNAQVLKDGTYVKSKSDKLTYGTMVFIRVRIVTDMALHLASAVTIAVRYSAVRHQSKLREDEPEPQIINYVTQQHKLFISIATSHAFRMVGFWLWARYLEITKNMSEGNLDKLPELHAASCCLKAVSSRDASTLIETCRLACGGHGYMMSSALPTLYSSTVAAMTYEGENTVMLLQTARYLVKAWKKIKDGEPSTVSYLSNLKNNNVCKWENSPEGIIRGFQAVAAGKIKTAYDSIQSYVNAGINYEDAWNNSSVQLVSASESHCREVLMEVFWRETERITAGVSEQLAIVMEQLAELYLVYWALEKTGDLLLYSSISKTDVAVLQSRYEELLGLIRPNAVGLVDAFDIRDEMLNSTLGAYDGRVYERIMEEALKSPLNQEPVNESFLKYIKPAVMSKI